MNPQRSYTALTATETGAGTVSATDDRTNPTIRAARMTSTSPKRHALNTRINNVHVIRKSLRRHSQRTNIFRAPSTCGNVVTWANPGKCSVFGAEADMVTLYPVKTAVAGRKPVTRYTPMPGNREVTSRGA